MLLALGLIMPGTLWFDVNAVRQRLTLGNVVHHHGGDRRDPLFVTQLKIVGLAREDLVQAASSWVNYQLRKRSLASLPVAVLLLAEELAVDIVLLSRRASVVAAAIGILLPLRRRIGR